MSKVERRPEHARDPSLEQLLATMNEVVAPSARSTTAAPAPSHPPVFIVGVARSGTTLALQWLAESGAFAYPSNIASRFFRSPRFGAMVHRAFVDYDARGELCGQASTKYRSVLGKTAGAASPNEFWYFWRRFFHFGDVHQLGPDELKQVDLGLLAAELAGFEEVFDKPIAMKAMILDWHLDALVGALPSSILMWMQRPTSATAASLYRAREAFYGDPAQWYSFKPPQYERLRSLSPVQQVVAQVLVTESAIEATMRQSPKAFLHVAYEAFCKDPGATWNELQQRMRQRGYELPDYRGVSSFDAPTDRDQSAFERAEPEVRRVLEAEGL